MTGVGVDALATTSYWRHVVEIQGLFRTVGERYLATLLAVFALVLVFVVLYGFGRFAADRLSSDTVQAIQGFVLTVVGVVLTIFLIVVWRLTSEVEEALGFLVIQPSTAVRALVTGVVFLGAITFTRLTKRSIKYGTARDTITAHQREVAHHIVQILVFVPVIGFVVALWEIPVESLFLGAGAIGIIVGFAARQTLSGALSGFVILFARPFEVGDWVEVQDQEGIVTDITLYNTQIRTFDEEHLLVPNDTVTGNEITNYTKTDRLRLTTEVGIDYTCEVATAAAVATEAMESCEEVANQPEPDVVRHSFGDSAVVLQLRYWIDRPTIQRKWRAQNEVIETVKRAFEDNDIKIPFPQRELTDRTETEGIEFSVGHQASGDGREETDSTGADTSDADHDETQAADEPDSPATKAVTEDHDDGTHAEVTDGNDEDDREK